MNEPTTDREDFICVNFDAICEEYPGPGEVLEQLLASYVEIFREIRDNGFAIVIRSDRASQSEHHECVRQHLERIGMPYDVIMPSQLLSQEGFNLQN